MKRLPYVGVASVTLNKQALEIRDCVSQSSNRQVAIGVGVSHKTLDGIPTKWAQRYVDPLQIYDVFPHEGTLNLVHYNCDDPTRLEADFDIIWAICGSKLGGIQLNQTRQGDVDYFEYLKNYRIRQVIDHPEREEQNIRFILQVRPMAFTSIGNLYFWLEPNLPYITDVLMDMSLGRGIEMDKEVVDQYLETLLWLRESLPDLGLGVAGGLSADNLSVIAPLFAEFPSLSIDAEGRLRDENDNLDLTKAIAYVQNAYKFTDTS